MTKAWCTWCENGEYIAKHGYLWICEKCVNELTDNHEHIKSIYEILKGTHPRNKKEENKIDTVLKYIKDMEEFTRKWDNTMKMF